MELIQNKAVQTGVKHTITSMLCEGAFDAVIGGDTATHDRIVGQCLRELDAKTDVIVLAQASMARVVDAMKPGEMHVPVLSSPRLGVQYVKQVLDRPPSVLEQKPTDILENEHHVIQKVVGTFAVFAEELEAGREVKPETLREILEFMRTFADKCHHGKEETHLFPLLERRGVPVRGCPMGALIGEHQRGRMLVTGLAAATETYAKEGASAMRPVLDNLRSLMDLYPSHIWKEDYLLFPLTNKILSAEEQRELREKFEAVEVAIGADVHHRFEQAAEKLDKETHRS
jgi:hemerythrin-like domain-containing protein